MGRSVFLIPSMSRRGIFSKPHLFSLLIQTNVSLSQTPLFPPPFMTRRGLSNTNQRLSLSLGSERLGSVREPNQTRSLWANTRVGTGIVFKEPNPTGSRPSDLIGLRGTTNDNPPPQHTRKGKEDKERETDPTGGREQLGGGKDQQGV